MSKLRFLSRHARLYYNSGTYAVPVWNHITLRTRIGYRKGTEAEDVTAGDSEEKIEQLVRHSRSLEFEMLVEKDIVNDTTYQYLADAAEDLDACVEFAVAQGDITTVGTKFRRLTTQIHDWDEDLDNKMTVKVTAKPAPVDDAELPSTDTVSA